MSHIVNAAGKPCYSCDDAYPCKYSVSVVGDFPNAEKQPVECVDLFSYEFHFVLLANLDLDSYAAAAIYRDSSSAFYYIITCVQYKCKGF